MMLTEPPFTAPPIGLMTETLTASGPGTLLNGWVTAVLVSLVVVP